MSIMGSGKTASMCARDMQRVYVCGTVGGAAVCIGVRAADEEGLGAGSEADSHGRISADGESGIDDGIEHSYDIIVI
jgi:hypothetical protein